MGVIQKAVSMLKSKGKYFCTSQAIFLYVTLLYLLLMYYQTKFVPGSVSSNSQTKKELKFILILCGGTGTQGSKQASDVGRQIRQAEVMLKSAVLFTKKRLHFHVIADSMKLFGRLVNRTDGWPDSYRRKIRFSMHNVWYPQVRGERVSLYSLMIMFVCLHMRTI